jgi:hypothetical protein
MFIRSFLLPGVAFGSLALHAQDTSPAPAQRRGPAGLVRPMQAGVQRLPVSAQAGLKAELPPLPEGVEELKFADFYKLPVGPRGLEPSAHLLSLDGKKVRLSGFFVFEDWGSCSCPAEPQPTAAPNTPAARRQRVLPAWMKHVVPGRIMLSPVPVTVSLGHYGLCDDLPPQVAFLEIVPRFGEPVFYQPGIFAVTGTLKLGTKEEPDGRVSFVRVKVEQEANVVRLAASAAAPSASQAQPASATAPSPVPSQASARR